MRVVVEVAAYRAPAATTPACLHIPGTTSTKEVVVHSAAAPGKDAAATKIITGTLSITMIRWRMPKMPRKRTMTAKWSTTATCSDERMAAFAHQMSN